MEETAHSGSDHGPGPCMSADVWDRLDKAITPHCMEDCPSMSIPNSYGWTLQGHSSAGERTGFMIPELRLFLDGGMHSCKQAEHILVTHSHQDHTCGLPRIAMDSLTPLEQRPKVYIPQEAANPLRMMARAIQAVNECRDIAEKQEMNVIGVAPGESFKLACGKKGGTPVLVHVIECVHRVPCCGYVISSLKNKLKEELQGLPKEEIQARRKAGEDVTETITAPVLAFLGDTTCAAFDEGRNDVLKNVPIIVVECTGFGVGSEEKQELRGHSHWSSMRHIIAARPHTTFVLIHLSRGVKEKDAVSEIFESGLRNIFMFLDSGVVDFAALHDANCSTNPH